MDREKTATHYDHVRMRYLDDFQCLGDQCPDTCCSGMRIFLTSDELVQLKRKAKNHPKLITEIDTHFQVTKTQAPQKEVFGSPNHVPVHLDVFLPNENKDCGFLDEQKLCRIHKTVGHEALAHTCAQYPRNYLRIGPRVEASATVACPEVARLALGSRQALEFTPTTTERHTIYRVTKEIDPATTVEHYERQYESVRSYLIELMNLSDYTLRQRIFLMLAFSDSIQNIYHLGTVRFDQSVLDESMSLFRTVDIQKSLLDQLDALRVPFLPQFEIARDVFAARRFKSHHREFNSWFDRVMYRSPAPSNAPEDLFMQREHYLLPPATLLGKYGFANNNDAANVFEIFKQVSERYILHYIQTHPFTSSPTLSRYLTLTNLHLLLARLLFSSTLETQDIGGNMQADEIEKKAIHSYQVLAKVIFHVTDFSLLLEHYLVEQGFLELNRSVILLPADAT